MKMIARAVTALALLAFASPALPCGDKQMKTTTASAPASAEKAQVEKAKEAKDAQAKAKTAAKPATAAN